MPTEQPVLHGMSLPRRTEAEQRTFFEQVKQAAHEAERACGPIHRDIALAGKIVRLTFAGPALLDMLFPAISHLLADEGTAPDCVIHLWESERSGIAIPAAPCEPGCFTHRGDIWTMMSRSIRSAFNVAENALSLFDVDESQAIFWTRSAETLPSWVRAAPLRTLFHWLLEAQCGQLLHAAAVGTQDGGILITGRGGAGKSTTALNCLRDGFHFVGDDYVAVTLDPDPVVHSLYCTAKIDRAAVYEFADFTPTFSDQWSEEKGVIQLGPAHPGVVRSLPLKAIFTPEFADEAQSSVAFCERDRLRSAASATTMSQLPHAGEQTVDFIDRLIDRLPNRLLRLGTARERAPAALRQFLVGQDQVEARTSVVRSGSTPLVSVIIPVFNGARFLADVVGSVLAQDYPMLDLIVVDDGSCDSIDDAVEALPIDVRLLKQRNQGPSAARNTGIRNAGGEFITFIDVDDLWPSRRLQAGVLAFTRNSAFDVVTGYGQLSEYDESLGRWIFVDDPRRGFPYYISAALFRRDAFEKVGLFDERLRYAEDVDWFIRARESGLNIEWLDDPMVLVRRHTGNTTFGRDQADLNPLRLFKNMLDRQRTQPAGDG